MSADPQAITNVIPFSRYSILNPKRATHASVGRASWYPYYAGFSEKFARNIIASSQMTKDSKVSDPWNGSGTTTAVAAGLGYDAYGYDLNPVMVLAARARMLSKRQKSSLIPLGLAIAKNTKPEITTSEPLLAWFSPRSAGLFRGLETTIQTTLVGVGKRVCYTNGEEIQSISDLAAFFYVALFRTARQMLGSFKSSNPTWLKESDSLAGKLDPAATEISTAFAVQVAEMAEAILTDELPKDSEVVIAVGPSDSISLPSSSVDLVLSSPPYCTRIDYAVATRVELALLGYKAETEFDELRRKLIGTSTVPAVAPRLRREWGKACNQFLEKLEAHTSKASSTYYLKNHLQYFDSIFLSLGEISRTLKQKGRCILVVQDSFYKEIHNPLPLTITQMARHHGLKLGREVAFEHQRTMASVNPEVRRYRAKTGATESVLCFSKL